MKARRNLSTAAWHGGIVILRNSTPFSPDEQHQVYVDPPKEKEKGQKRDIIDTSALWRSLRAPPKERAKVNGKNSFLRNSCLVCLYRQMTGPPGN